MRAILNLQEGEDVTMNFGCTVPGSPGAVHHLSQSTSSFFFISGGFAGRLPLSVGPKMTAQFSSLTLCHINQDTGAASQAAELHFTA